MWRRPFGNLAGARAIARNASTGGRLICAIGDVHGRADLLAKLFDQLERIADEERAERPLAIFVGDYIDRGPSSRDVLDLLLSGRPYGYERRLLMGNHEQMLRNALRDSRAAAQWLALGGVSTLVSYGVRPPPISSDPAILGEAMNAMREAMPAAHHRLIADLERYVSMGDYLFVHAGINPDKPLEKQTEADLFWIRDRFLSSRKALPMCVVHGHTPVPRPTASAPRIAIDTGAHATGVLTAARIQDEAVSFVSVTMRGEPAPCSL